MKGNIYNDVRKNTSDLYAVIEGILKERDCKLEDLSNKIILDEAKELKRRYTEGGNWYELILQDRDEVAEYDLEDWKNLHKEYRDLCKFITKWSNIDKAKDLESKKDYLKGLAEGTVIEVKKYGKVKFIKVNRTRFVAEYKNGIWTFPISFVQK